MPTISDLQKQLTAIKNERGWGKYHTPRNLATSVIIEAAELLELFQWRDGLLKYVPIDKEKAEDEVADILIYLLHFCDVMEIDLIECAQTKISKNTNRIQENK